MKYNMGIHTFELCAKLTSAEYRACGDYFFEAARGLQRCCYRKENYLTYNLWSPCGVIVYLKEVSNGMGLGAYLHLRINPNKAIGELEPTRLFYITDKSMILLVNVLSELVQRLPVELDSLTFWLFRIDLCQDCILDHEDDVKAYIRLLHKGSSFHNWRLVSYQDEKDEHSFRRVNQRYQVTAYDKLYQIKDRGQATTWDSDQQILRVEVALLPDGISHIREKLKVEAKDWLTLLQEFNYSSAQIICNVLNKLIPQGMYCSLAFAKTIIQNSHFYQHKKQALIEFLSSVNRFSHIDTNELKKRKNGKKRLRQPMALNINPVTIDARSNILSLPSLLPNERNTDSLNYRKDATSRSCIIKKSDGCSLLYLCLKTFQQNT